MSKILLCNVIYIKSHVSNDCESLPIDKNHTSASHGHPGTIRSQDQLFADNSSDVNESQSIDITIHLNNHAPNDCESTSGSDNIATRVRAKNVSPSESLSYEY